MSWLTTLQAAQAEIVDALADAGLPDTLQAPAVVLELKTLTAPGVWVKLTALTGTLDGNYAQVTIYVVVPDTDLGTVLDALEALSGPVMAAVPPMSTPTLVAFPMPQGGTPAPALRYTHDLVIE